jgi:YD repeat-containing protein
VQATPAYDPASLMSAVAYSNGTTATMGWDVDGRSNTENYTGPSSTNLFSDTETLSPAGQVSADAESDTSGNWTDGYTYDNADRLTAATEPGNTYGYSYTPTGGCGSLTTAGANSDRTSMVDNGATTTTYCYNSGDQLTSTTTANMGGIGYDTDRNTATLRPDTLGYNGADAPVTPWTDIVGPEQPGGNTLTTQTTYTRDATGRVINRTTTVDGATTSNVSYGYPDSSATPGETHDTVTGTTTLFDQLPGGAQLTSTSGVGTWSYPDLHGDDVVTANQAGTQTGTTTSYDPFGNVVHPNEQTSAYTYGFEGKHDIGTDNTTPIALIEMGERVYSPAIGRFLQ